MPTRIPRSALFADVPAVVTKRMRAIRKVDTRPEMIVRSLAHKLGYRFRLHRRDLPGTPDLVFPSRRKVVLVHGCFWHRHDCPAGRKVPGRNQDYWLPKLARNVARDEEARRRLADLGWESLVIWECQARDADLVSRKLVELLGPRQDPRQPADPPAEPTAPPPPRTPRDR